MVRSDCTINGLDISGIEDLKPYGARTPQMSRVSDQYAAVFPDQEFPAVPAPDFAPVYVISQRPAMALKNMRSPTQASYLKSNAQAGPPHPQFFSAEKKWKARIIEKRSTI